jgi:hypothetical protein
MHVCITPTGIGAEPPLKSVHCSIAPPQLLTAVANRLETRSGLVDAEAGFDKPSPLPNSAGGIGKGFLAPPKLPHRPQSNRNGRDRTIRVRTSLLSD